MPLQSFSIKRWDDVISESLQRDVIQTLESGKILFFPDLPFELSPHEQRFLSPEFADHKSKNISYSPLTHELRGTSGLLTEQQSHQLQTMMLKYYQYALQFVNALFPRYTQQLIIGRTSYRPVQISGRVTSYRKDDKRLHVDAFPSSPNQGKRILRVFCNVNPFDQPRVWRVGEPFEKVVNHFLPKLSSPLPGKSALLKMLKITKSYRTLYDHFMLQLHDNMKADETYQKKVEQTEIQFPPGSAWIVQTDNVSHAAMQGQYVFEQTFYLPVEVMQNEALSPLRILERKLGKLLV